MVKRRGVCFYNSWVIEKIPRQSTEKLSIFPVLATCPSLKSGTAIRMKILSAKLTRIGLISSESLES